MTDKQIDRIIKECAEALNENRDLRRECERLRARNAEKSISIDTVKETNAMCNIDDIVRGFIVKDGKILYVTNILNGCRQEFKDIHKICDELNNNMKEIDRLMEWNYYLRFQLEECKKLTVKEFAQKLKEKLHNDYVMPSGETDERLVFGCIDEALKEYEQ